MAACGEIIWILLAVTIFTSAQPDGSLRLVDGDTENCGRVEVFYNGTWGTICDDSWHSQDANLVCRQLGYESAERRYYRAKFGEGTGPIWIDQISCRNGDNSIMDCRHNGWGIHNCGHQHDAGVCCRRIEPIKPESLPLRLNCPTYNEDGTCNVCPAKLHPDPGDCSTQVSVEGIVEVYYKNEWRPVSADGWDTRDARVACGELGYPIALGIPEMDVIWPNWDGSKTASCDIGSAEASEQCDPLVKAENTAFRERLNSTYLKKVACMGNENRLLDCYFPEFGPHNNPPLRVATVQCGYLPHQKCYNESAEVYRTRSGPVPWMGRAEVQVKGVWGTICDTYWDHNSGSVFCRGLGYGTAKTITYGAAHGRGVGLIHYSRLRCKGNERYLSGCTHETGSTCEHRRDAGVVCNAPQTCELPNAARLMERPDPRYPWIVENFVEVKGSQGWGQLCYGNLELEAAQVMCRENKNEFAVRIQSDTLDDYDGVKYYGRLECNGDEMTVNECSMSIIKVLSCQSGYTRIDCTTALPDLVPDLGAFERSLRYYPYVDRLPMYYLSCALEENCLASSAINTPNHQRNLLRFDSLTMNWGTYDFLPNLQQHEWLWHSCHQHYHSFEAFIHYDILNMTTGKKEAEGHKASFCLSDSLCASGTYRRYTCGFGSTQGISVNCGDLYGRHLDCQWIDVTDVPLGTYMLRLHVNPDRLAPESDYENNEVQCEITFKQGFYLGIGSCGLTDH